MPIRPENRGRYPKNWREISHRIKAERAGWRCECDGRCGRPPEHLWRQPDGSRRCNLEHGLPHPDTGKPVILTTAHLDHTPEHCDDDNLLAMCQGCHLHYDRGHHAETRATTRGLIGCSRPASDRRRGMSPRTYADAVTDQRIRARGGRPYPERITLALDLHGLEGPEVDVACGAVEPAVDRWETGEEIPTTEQLRLLGELTGFPIGFFFTEPGPRLDDSAVFICAVDPAGGSIQLNGPERPEQLPLIPTPKASLPVPKPDTPPPGPLPECSGCERPMRRATWVRQHGRCSRCGPARRQP